MNAPPTARPIATLTLNPCLDVSYEFQSLIPDQKVRADHTRFDPGGNGLNIGRALKRLDVRAANCTLLAGEIGLLVKRLLADKLENLKTVSLAGETRINCAILERSPRVQYELDGIGPEVGARELADVSERFLQAASEGGGRRRRAHEGDLRRRQGGGRGGVPDPPARTDPYQRLRGQRHWAQHPSAPSG